MSEISFEIIKQRIHDFDLAELHPSADWQQFFDDAIRLLDHSESESRNYAVDRLQKGTWSERMQAYREPGFVPVTPSLRFPPILNAIMRQSEPENLLLQFTAWLSLNDEQRQAISDWLQTDRAKELTIETATVIKIQCELYEVEDWAEAKSFLEPLFEHRDDLVRAASARAFGEMYASGAANLVPLKEIMEKIKAWEIERPGFAGAFISSLIPDPILDDEGIDLEDWFLEIIAKRKGEEPYVRFYNGIDFHAHELLSCNPDAVRKLTEYGAEVVAAMAATEENYPIEGMKEILIGLAKSDDEFVARICSWHLAYNYRCLHPQADLKGFVRVEERDDVDVFLVFNPAEQAERPFAATIYPKQEFLSDEIAWKWIDKLVPPHSRPAMEANTWPYQKPQIAHGRAMFVYGPYIFNLYGDTITKSWERVWVKFPLQSKDWQN